MRFIFLFFLVYFLSVISQAQTDSTQNTAIPDTTNQEAQFPIFTTISGDADENMGSQDVSGLLQSSRDVFNSTAGFNFSMARFRIRGYDPSNTFVLINGIKVNDPENGWASWSNWGGLNDITRYMEMHTGITASSYTFGGINGYSYIETRASSMRPGTKASFAYSNRNYGYRSMVTHSTGMIENGWALTVSGSRRWSEEGYIEGTYFNGWSYFLSLEKKINASHSIGLTGFGAPLEQGRQGVAVQEAYDLAGTNFYNPNWGYQNGEKRNSRISRRNQPMMILTDYWKLSELSDLKTSLFYSKGSNGITALNWYDAKDPRPDYYKYLPSYYKNTDENTFNTLTGLWQTDANTSQVNWDNLYFANGKNLYTVINANGVNGSSLTGNRSKYIVEDVRNDLSYYGINTIYNKQATEKLNYSGGITLTHYRNNYYKTLNDLLGGDFWVDVDQFAERDFSNDSVAQNDLSTPNKIIYEGNRFGYDYNINVNNYDGFFQAEYKSGKIETYSGISLSQTGFWRDGNIKNGRFPDDSEGNSTKYNFTNYGIKAGLLYKITGRHLLNTNVAYLTRAPLPKNAFSSPRTRNTSVTALSDETVYGGDISYIIRYPKFKTRITGYYTEFKNQLYSKSFYHDDYRTFVNYVMTGVDYLHSGIELGAEANILPSLSLSGVLAAGQYTYNSRPLATITRDNSSELLAENRVVYLKNYRVGGIPQTAASLGLKYSGSNFWFASVNLNYFDDIYSDINPDRRTAEATQKFAVSDPQWEQILTQEKIKGGYILNASAGKSWKIKSYFLNLNISVNNVLNNTNTVVGAFEQLRYSPSDIDKFPPKYTYMLGTTFFILTSLRF